MAQPLSSTDPLPDLPRVLILDADDSYTRNILDLILGIYPTGSPQAALLESRVLILRANRFDWSALSTQIIPHFAAIILGPGPGRPSSASKPGATLEHPASIFTRLFSPLPLIGNHHLPTFGLCLGHQALGFAYGAAVHPAPKVLHGQLSKLQLELDSLGRPLGVLNRLQQDTSVVRYNSLTVDPSSISDQVEITAWAQDDPSSRTVMGLAHKTLPFHSVQFHPESVCSTDGSQILRSFFQVVSDSAHVNSETGIGRSKAYSNLPDEILELSELRRGVEREISSSGTKFQLRSIVFKNSDLSPEDVFKNSIKARSPLGHVWLDSADSLAASQPVRQECCSHMGSVDFLVSYFAARKSLSIRAASAQQGSEQPLGDSTTFWDWLRNVQDELQACTEISSPTDPALNGTEQANGHSNEKTIAAPVGFMGYIGYELLSESLAHYNLPCRASADVPDAELGFCNTALSYHHASSTWTASALVVSHNRTENNSSNSDFRQRFPLSVGLSQAEYEDWIRTMREIFYGPKQKNHQVVELPEQQQHQQSNSSKPTMPNRALESIVSEKDYLEAITKAQTQIISGESYELCLTTQFRGELAQAEEDGGHFERYEGLRRANPAPYGAYLRFGAYDTTILSSSPERFLRVDGAGGVEMKPIKGTARRVLGDVEADQAAGQTLQNDPKERAENLMITDLIRHDLLGFCVPGSVRVARLFGLESVATVHSLVSTVQGSLRPHLNPVDALAAAFPPGSMTGAPKLSSIEILDRLELHHPRGPYSGILGFIAIDGRSDMSVVIRTAIIRNNHITVGAGGAITSLSKKENEWNEVRLKVDAVQRSLKLSPSSSA
ncbi:Protein phosphatase PP2A regulatory subunit B [Puccinia graminis f. sp. tritici]|uniref:aminodeoxychorismate synthase n=1 Tax=Puccinia graminis f. sp. tritici TaxID=56615 RepID=A0A5B0NUZ5_PUCGR|nr:Protein phosphatase PP2A regulatory subunit B [Puccinia graminis f. sp. tritici]KAA1092314.1 Protein phosphatase PP2A regulatory subunit B [Puccinia graminis f. sp. tritici]